jgi:O-antigen/teichoic acid export membrane protein
MALPVLVSLVAIPLYVQAIGEERYGILSLIWLLLGYFGLLDLGLTRATANTLARMRDAEPKQRGRILVSSLYINALLGVAGGLVLYGIGQWAFASLVKASPEIMIETMRALPLIALTLPLALLSGVILGAMEAHERFLAVNLLQLVGGTAGQIMPVIYAVHVRVDLLDLVSIALAVKALTLLASIALVAKDQPIRLYRYDGAAIKDLFRYGAWVSVSSLSTPLLTSLDQFIISSRLGAGMVTYYAIPMSLILRLQIVSGALARSIFPRLSRYGQRDAADLAEKSMIALAYLLAGLCAAALFITPAFLAWWIAPAFADKAATATLILIPGAWINGLALICLSYLQGQGMPGAAAKAHAVQVIPFALVLWLSIHAYGLPGAAGAWSGRCLIDMLTLFILARFRLGLLLRLLIPASVLAGAFWLARTGVWPGLTSLIPAIVASVCTIALGLLCEPNLRHLAQSTLRRLTRSG